MLPWLTLLKSTPPFSCLYISFYHEYITTIIKVFFSFPGVCLFHHVITCWLSVYNAFLFFLCNRAPKKASSNFYQEMEVTVNVLTFARFFFFINSKIDTSDYGHSTLPSVATPNITAFTLSIPDTFWFPCVYNILFNLIVEHSK